MRPVSASGVVDWTSFGAVLFDLDGVLLDSSEAVHRHWEAFFERTKAPREGHVHVGASLFHDIEPSNELGLRSVWINRTGEPATVQPTRELSDLFSLPETLDELVAA